MDEKGYLKTKKIDVNIFKLEKRFLNRKKICGKHELKK